MSSVSLISDNLLAAAHLVILFPASVPPKLMAKDKKDSSSPERAMDERRGEETKAVKTELQKKSTKWGRNGGRRRFMSFVWKQRDSRLGGRRRLNSTVKESAPPAISAIHVAATTCANLHFLTWKTSRPRSVQVHLASAKGGDTETDGEERGSRQGSDNMPNSHLSAR